MASFVLIPGAMHGSWTWDRVVPLLERAGYRTAAPDLPGMGTNSAMNAADVTLEDWAQFVSGLVRDAEPPVILAGHSRGGLVIGEAAERAGDALLGLIYVTALLVPPGRTGREVAIRGAAGHDAVRDSVVGIMPPEMAIATCYTSCTPADAAWAAAKLCPEPMRPLNTTVTASWERWGRVPRAYIECSEDRLLSLEHQREMQAAAPCDPVITLKADHSPFLCVPEALAEAMIAVARRFEQRADRARLSGA
jgi:pimeloyl-ACP methyl ester carboxylesterase